MEAVAQLALALVAGGIVLAAALFRGRPRCQHVAVFWPDEVLLEFRCERYADHTPPHREEGICWTEAGEVTLSDVSPFRSAAAKRWPRT